MTTSDSQKITVYFDGQCPVCSREVGLYRRLDRRNLIAWRDLAGPGDPLRGEPFTLAAALQLLHVKSADGTLQIGMDAHLLMWQRLPGLNTLAWALRRWPGVRHWVETLYLAFTKRRPGLVRRRQKSETARG